MLGHMLSHLKWLTLLSLDAPLVAIAWQALLSKSGESQQSWHHYLIVFLSVWLGYAADRWFDNLKAKRTGSEQHCFYQKYQRPVLAIWILILASAIILSVATLSASEITRGLGLMLVSIAYTAFAQFGRRLRIYPFAKGALTSFLILAASLLFQASIEIPLLAILPVWFLFLANCLLIRSWTRPNENGTLATASMAGLASLCAGIYLIATEHQAIGFSYCLSSLLLLAVQLMSSNRTLIERRVLADLCLLAPVPMLLF